MTMIGRLQPNSALTLFLFVSLLYGCKVSQWASDEPFYGPYGGAQLSCGNIQIVLLAPSMKTYLKIRLDVSSISLSGENLFEVGDSLLSVEEVEYDREVRGIFCNDVMPREKPRIVQKREAQSGKIKVLLDSEDLSNFKTGQPYSVDVIIEDLKLDENDEPVSLRIINASVGWLPG